jgi:hypothetical protein
MMDETDEERLDRRIEEILARPRDAYKWSPEVLAKVERLRQLPHEEAVRQMLADESLRNVENDDTWPAESGLREVEVGDFSGMEGLRKRREHRRQQEMKRETPNQP